MGTGSEGEGRENGAGGWEKRGRGGGGAERMAAHHKVKSTTSSTISEVEITCLERVTQQVHSPHVSSMLRLSRTDRTLHDAGWSSCSL